MKKLGKLAVVGTGYVGLPLAVLAKEKGWDVVGYDIDQKKVEAINRRVSPVKDVVEDQALEKFPLVASTDPAVVAHADVIVIAVPTPVTHDKQPDLAPLIGSVKDILPHLKAKQTLIVESTVNPGVMDEVVLPLIQSRGGLKELRVAYCPERINPGDKKWTVRNIPRVLGAYTKEAEASALHFYTSILEAPVKVMNSVTEAEAVKIFENSFRDVNIAFVNEMARSFDRLGIDVMNVIEGASTKPFAFLAHFPGNGVGGHCIGVDPYYMIERGHSVGFDHQFLKLAREINNSMPAFTVELLRRGLAELHVRERDLTVAVLGVSYKKDTADDRESPAIEVRRLLEEGGFQVVVFDPYFPASSNVATLEEALAAADAVMLATNHTQFIKALTPAALRRHQIRLLVDGKNALDPAQVASAGVLYYGIGRTQMAVTQPQGAVAEEA
ncbi:MAG: nucleotide sugar dehydrogenase [Patescibacteria group bacterium]